MAYPSYVDHLTRGRIPEGVAALSDARVKMERYFLDNRQYPPNVVACDTLVNAKTVHFGLTCSGLTKTTYLVESKGVIGTVTEGFHYTINETNTKQTLAVRESWKVSVIEGLEARGIAYPPAPCWVLKRDGSC
ncbi:MAG: hypothetical protein LBE15_00185 [Burkholderiales bacterium]|nr:hypothetical protein [Burkholderiales bacterium]